MSELSLVALAAALSDAAHRQMSAIQLAHAVGAEAVLLLVEDQDAQVLLPAPGFPATLPGGETWRRFLQTVRVAGVHHGRVAYPTIERVVSAIAVAGSGAALVLVGETVRAECTAPLETVLPLIASTIRAEQAAVSARGELRAAQEYAREAETLARALDSTRAQVERTLHQLAAQTQALNAARTRAEEATRAKDEFLAMLGHELRNPLSPILTALQLMRLKKQTSPELEVIERQVANVMRLVDDLLDVSRITRGKIELRKRNVDLADIAARAIEMVSPELDRKHQRLHADIPGAGLVINADPARMAQVISNLLNNASKYSESGSVITLRASVEANSAIISVQDEGIGLAPDMLERVFELFEQHPQALDRSAGGLGLGLAIVRSLVRMHGGRVWATSDGPGRGSVFVIQVPLATAAAGRAGVSPLDAVGEDTLPRGRGARVLVVDDNDDAASLLHEALSALGYEVRTAADGPAALRIAGEFTPAIAVLDIGLPVMDGYDLARRLRAQGAIRLVAVTGYGQQSDQERSRAAGFDAHLVKPVALAELARVLDVLVKEQSE
jgi:signal transduction histidine kinase/ActR/RegA family two-component response regulator